MNCDDVREALADRLDGLLPARRAARLDAHLTGCEACAAAREHLAALRERVYAPLPVAAPTAELRARIVARAASARAPRSIHRIVILCAASFAAGVVLTLALFGRLVPDPTPTIGPAPTEIQEASPVAPPPLRRIY